MDKSTKGLGVSHVCVSSCSLRYTFADCKSGQQIANHPRVGGCGSCGPSVATGAGGGDWGVAGGGD